MLTRRGRKKANTSLRSTVLRSHLHSDSFGDLGAAPETPINRRTEEGDASLPEPQPQEAKRRSDLNVPPSSQQARGSLGDGDCELLSDYIGEVVTAAVGARRAEDFRFFSGEMERTRLALREEISSLLRETLASAPTPEQHRTALSQDGGQHESYAARVESTGNAPYRHRFSSALPSHQPVPPQRPSNAARQPSPRRAPSPHRPDPAVDRSHMDDFLRQLHNLTFSDPALNSHSAPRPSGSGYRFQNFDKWGLKFDNRNMSVDDFLFRLERLRVSYGASWDDVVINFHHFVAGPVETWFWAFVKTNPNISWIGLKNAMIEHFRSLETDSELSRRLYDRHQGTNESFDDFYLAVQQLNGRLRVPKTDAEIIDVLKNNVKKQMGLLLITFETNSLADMVHVCRKVEKYLVDREAAFQRARGAPIAPPRRSAVSELVAEDPVEDDTHLPDIEAFHLKREKDSRNYTCWNCKGRGHSFFECPDPQRALFCFRCGWENTTSPQCPRCSGNDPKSSPKFRGNCSSEKNPESS